MPEGRDPAAAAVAAEARWPDGPIAEHGTWAAYKRCDLGDPLVPGTRRCAACRAFAAQEVARRRAERQQGVQGRQPGIRAGSPAALAPRQRQPTP